MSPNFTLPIPLRLQQKQSMEKQTGPAGIKGIVRWAITPNLVLGLVAVFAGIWIATSATNRPLKA